MSSPQLELRPKLGPSPPLRVTGNVKITPPKAVDFLSKSKPSLNSRKCRKRKRHFSGSTASVPKQKRNSGGNNSNNHKQVNSKRQKGGHTHLNNNNNNKSDVENLHGNSKPNNRLGSGTKHLLRRLRGSSKYFIAGSRPELIIPPTKFLLGGNISDPLNLNSLQDEAINASMNAATPKSSPITTPPKVEVKIPPNINDPLHLLDPVDSLEYEQQLISPMKRRSKHRNRKRKLKIRTESICPQPEIEPPDDAANDNANPPVVTDDEAFTVVTTVCQTVQSDTFDPEKLIRNNLKLDLSGDESTHRKRKTSESHHPIKNKIRRMDSMDKIVSPVIPQPGAWKRLPKILAVGAPRNRSRLHSQTTVADDLISPTTDDQKPIDSVTVDEPTVDKTVDIQETSTTSIKETCSVDKSIIKPVFKPENARFQYGNHSRYYPFQNVTDFNDVRLKIFQRNQSLFRDKDVLDIGCHAGHMTIAVARRLHPKSIVGIDIDPKLIRKAVHHKSLFVPIPGKKVYPDADVKRIRNHRIKREKPKFFPISFPICYRGIDGDGTADGDGSETIEVIDKRLQFPYNVNFRHLNYVPMDEQALSNDTQEYDLILCLSITKWIHLNWGDAGLKLTFRRMFNQLRPGGKLILDAQNWVSYKKKKKLTETIFNNYQSIEFFPNKFHEYLLSPEVGFSHSYPLGSPKHSAKGFRRPIHLFIKGDFTPSQMRWSDNYNPQTPIDSRGYYADMKRSYHYSGIMSTRQCPSVHGASSSVHSVSGQLTGGTISLSQETTYGGRYHQYFPSHGLSSTSQYYNPMESDSYLPSYDNEVQRRHYVFASPLYSTVWSPPSGRKSAGQTPLFGSIRKVTDDDQWHGRRHVYPPSADSVRSVDESGQSPQVQYVYGPNSVRDADDSQSNREHVYAPTGTITNGFGENSSSPQCQFDSQFDGERSVAVSIDGGDSSRSLDHEHDNSPAEQADIIDLVAEGEVEGRDSE